MRAESELFQVRPRLGSACLRAISRGPAKEEVKNLLPFGIAVAGEFEAEVFEGLRMQWVLCVGSAGPGMGAGCLGFRE